MKSPCSQTEFPDLQQHARVKLSVAVNSWASKRVISERQKVKDDYPPNSPQAGRSQGVAWRLATSHDRRWSPSEDNTRTQNWMFGTNHNFYGRTFFTGPFLHSRGSFKSTFHQFKSSALIVSPCKRKYSLWISRKQLQHGCKTATAPAGLPTFCADPA